MGCEFDVCFSEFLSGRLRLASIDVRFIILQSACTLNTRSNGPIIGKALHTTAERHAQNTKDS